MIEIEAINVCTCPSDLVSIIWFGHFIYVLPELSWNIGSSHSTSVATVDPGGEARKGGGDWQKSTTGGCESKRNHAAVHWPAITTRRPIRPWLLGYILLIYGLGIPPWCPPHAMPILPDLQLHKQNLTDIGPFKPAMTIVKELVRFL